MTNTNQPCKVISLVDFKKRKEAQHTRSLEEKVIARAAHLQPKEDRVVQKVLDRAPHLEEWTDKPKKTKKRASKKV